VTELPISSPYRSSPNAPVTENERTRLSTRINDAFSDGKIDEEDYRGRLDRLFAAQTLGELIPVVDGLPPMQTYASPDIVASQPGEPGQLTPSRNAASLALVGVGVLLAVIALVAVLVAILL
jgi:hypothetical protein